MNNNNNIEIINKLQDYMFTSGNLTRIINNFEPTVEIKTEKAEIKTEKVTVEIKKPTVTVEIKKPTVTVEKTNIKKRSINENYKPKQIDSLFWCFYILKYGYSNYEMEIYNKYFVVEKAEKFKYIELIRSKKAILKIHKIKPLTEIED